MTEGCSWSELGQQDYRHGFERRAAWLRLSLRNSSRSTLERWLEVGHPRLSMVQLHYRNSSGAWVSEAIGLQVPRAARSAVGRQYDVLRVEIAPESVTDLLIRVESESQLALETVVWEPAAFRERRQAVDMWLAFAIGAMSLTMVSLLSAFFVYRKPFYLMFLLMLIGESVIETARTGFMSRHLWPAHLPMSMSVIAVGGMIASVGFLSYAFRTLPTLSRDALLRRAAMLLACGVLVFQVYAAAIDYGVGTIIWSWIFAVLTVLLGWCSLRDGRGGSREAYWIFFSVLLLAVIGLLRMPFLMRLLPHHLNDVISPLSTMFVILAVVLILADRERVQRQSFEVSRAKAASQVAFLARMSHELRAPLDIMLGTTQLLMRSSARPARQPGKEVTGDLREIMANGRHLLALIDEILDYSRGICGELELRRDPAVLPDLMDSLAAGSRLLAARRGNRFEMFDLSPRAEESKPTLLLDSGRLRQVLDNLISNAARHTRDGLIRLTYRIEPLEPPACRVHFEVSDTGEGIAAADQLRIFEPFERVGRSARYGGTGAGMGLAVARQLVALMGGDIEVRSTPGEGATFSFWISTDWAASGIEATDSPSRGRLDVSGYLGTRRRILLVDDDASSRLNLARLLGALGFGVEEIASGNLAVARLAAPPRPDLVITDQFMSDGDGWTVLDGVIRCIPGVPCLLVSAAPAEYPAGWPTDRQFSAVLLKPVDHDVLLHRVGELLRLEWQRTPEIVDARHDDTIDLPDPGELRHLAEMVKLGEVSAIIEWARHLRYRTPERAAFADRVEAAASVLDLDLLAALAKGELR